MTGWHASSHRTRAHRDPAHRHPKQGDPAHRHPKHPNARSRGQALTRAALILTVLALILAACGDGSDGAADDAAPDQEPQLAEEDSRDRDVGAPDGADDPEEAHGDETVGTLGVSDTELGEILVDGEGMTVYLFDEDQQGASTCYDGCAEAWPPLDGPVEAGEGVDATLIGAVERDDGSVQATYDDWPLYHFASDEAPGDVTGEGVGGDWWVVTADGQRLSDHANEDDEGSEGTPGPY